MASPAVDNPQLTNPDVQGFAVRLSSFISHVCVALLIAYSTKPQRYFYLPLLFQQALIIVAILLCWGRNQLSLSDIEFAIIQTRSPVSIYALLLVIPRMFLEKSAFKKDYPTNNGQSFFHRCFNSGGLDWALIKLRICGLLYGLSCFGINLVRKFKAGYMPTPQNQGSTEPFSVPISPPGPSQLERGPNATAWLALAVCSAFIYECILHRHGEERREIMHQLAGKRKKSLKAWPLGERVMWGFAATWFIVTKLHPWLPFLYVLIMFLNWSEDMRIWAIEDDFEWTYGQLLAISQATIILYPCLKLCYSRRQEIAALPRRLVLDAIWLVSGKGQAWTNAAECDLILKNSWNAFPPDVTPEEPGLPIANEELPAVATYPLPDGMRARNKRSRRRQNGTVPVEEEDIVDQIPRVRAQMNYGIPAGFGRAH